MTGDGNECCNGEQCKGPVLALWPLLYHYLLVFSIYMTIFWRDFEYGLDQGLDLQVAVKPQRITGTADAHPIPWARHWAQQYQTTSPVYVLDSVFRPRNGPCRYRRDICLQVFKPFLCTSTSFQDASIFHNNLPVRSRRSAVPVSGGSHASPHTSCYLFSWAPPGSRLKAGDIGSRS